MFQPLVTLAVTTLNRVTYLRNTLASALAQDYPNLEILVSDNGSQDETPFLLQALADGDSRVRLRRNEVTVPLHQHFTQCVEAARGDYFILLHDDDSISAGFVSELVRVATRYPDVNVVIPMNVTIDESGAVLRQFAKPAVEVFDGPSFVCDWLHRAGPQLLADVTTVLFRTTLLRYFGGYQGLRGGRNVDNLMFLQCAITSRVGFAAGAVFYWRSHPCSYGSNATPVEIAESGRDFMRHLRRDPRTVMALAVLAAPVRKRIVRDVAELTALEVLLQMKRQDLPFRWGTIARLLKRRRDGIFLYLVLRECLRETSPAVYYRLRDLMGQRRTTAEETAVETEDLMSGMRSS